MADEQAQNTTNNQQTEQNSSPVHGRIYNSQNPAFEQGSTQSDISSVDQQEGNMDHGECGGNQKDDSEEK